jgi:integrase
MTVGELIDAYRVTNPTERRRDDDQLARWWDRQLGACPVEQLTTSLIRRHVRTLATRGRSEWTINFYLRFFRRVCAWGVRMAALPMDCCAPIPLGKDRSTVLRVLTDDEERRLCAALGQPYALWVRFAILTGLEQSEQFTLLWRSVQLDRGVLLVPQGTTGTMVEWSVPSEAVTILQVLRQAYPTSLWVFPNLRTPTRPANIHTFYTGRWASAIRRANIPWVAWKDLRSTCGVRLAQQRMPIKEIAAFLRQTDLRKAYRYRAWLTGVMPRRGHPNCPRVPVFTDLTGRELQALIDRAPTDPPLTLGEMCRLYAVHYLKQRPARRNFEGIYRHLFRQWAHRPLADLSRKEIRLWYMGLARTPGHANKALTFLQRVYNVALYQLEVYDGLNPAIKMTRYPSPRRERFLSLEEAQRFMAGLPHLPLKQGAYFLTLLLTGARLSELRVMRWTDVEWSTRLWKKPRTKTGSTQFVPLPVQAVDALARLPRTSDWVFPGVNGQPWSRPTVQKLWDKIRRQWKMTDVTIHDLRRSCASYLAISGENLPTIQRVLNHTSLAHTAIYARLNTKAVDRALQTQADRLCGLVQAPVVLPALTQEVSSTVARSCAVVQETRT